MAEWRNGFYNYYGSRGAEQAAIKENYKTYGPWIDGWGAQMVNAWRNSSSWNSGLMYGLMLRNLLDYPDKPPFMTESEQTIIKPVDYFI